MIENGKPILDTAGEAIHAHGGWILPADGYWYWYGEDRRGDCYVACYRSRDLRTWERRGAILTADTPAKPGRTPGNLALRRPDGGKVNIERPKVLYAPATKQYVLWAHYENGADYRDAAACIATSDKPDADFVYRGSFRPFGNMSRDCTLFRDADGTAYFASASRDNADLKLYRLTDDLLACEAETATLFAGEYREAPAFFCRNGRYWVLSSHCTGWAPNQGGCSHSEKMDGAWSAIRDFGDATTFCSQPAFVLQTGDRYLYFGDRWMGGGDAYFTSTYVILEIRFREDGTPYIEYTENAPL